MCGRANPPKPAYLEHFSLSGVHIKDFGPPSQRVTATVSLFKNRETVTLPSENTETIFPMQVQCASYVRKYVSKAEKVRSGPQKMLLYEAEKPRGQGRAILEWGG